MQINRGYELVIGDYKTGDGFKVEHLQCQFEISKTANNKNHSNSASIEITNLAPEHLKILQTDYVAAVFKAGYYNTEIAQLFSGEVVRVTTRKTGPDLVTQIEMGSGYTELNHETLSKLVSPGKTVRDVFEEIRSAMPSVVRGVYNGANINSTLISGYPLKGEPRRIMDALSRAYRVDWRVDDDVLYVNDSSGGINEANNLAYVISQESGLIDIPYLVNEAAKGKKKKDPERKTSTVFRMLLNPRVMPGEIVKLDYLDFSGFYKVEEVRHWGDFRGNDWYTEVKASQYVKVDRDK